MYYNIIGDIMKKLLTENRNLEFKSEFTSSLLKLFQLLQITMEEQS